MKTFHRSSTYQTIFFLVIICCSSAFAQAATESTPEERAQRWDTWMKEQLTLSAEQEVKAHDINLKYAKQNEGLKAKEGSRKSKFQELKKTNIDKDAELKEILTEDQFKIYQEKKKDFQKQMLESLRN